MKITRGIEKTMKHIHMTCLITMKNHIYCLHTLPFDYEELLLIFTFDMEYHYEESFEISNYDMPNYYEDLNFPSRPKDIKIKVHKTPGETNKRN